jgi:hypothetical protein
MRIEPAINAHIIEIDNGFITIDGARRSLERRSISSILYLFCGS